MQLTFNMKHVLLAEFGEIVATLPTEDPKISSSSGQCVKNIASIIAK